MECPNRIIYLGNQQEGDELQRPFLPIFTLLREHIMQMFFLTRQHKDAEDLGKSESDM